MRVARRHGSELVLIQTAWVIRLVGACLVLAALAVAFLANSGQEVFCQAEEARPTCVITERTLTSSTITARIEAGQVRRIEVLHETEGDEDSYCVVISTDAETHQVGRCSLKPEPRLQQLVEQLRSFFAGQAPSLRNEVSDASSLWFALGLPGLMGLMLLLLPKVSRVELSHDEVRWSSWSLLGVHRRRVPLGHVRGVSVELGGADPDGGALYQLVLHLSDGGRLELNEPTDRSLVQAREAIESVLASRTVGYR